MVNQWNRMNTINRAARIFAFSYLLKMACLDERYYVRKNIFMALADGFCILSIINFLNAVVYLIMHGFSEGLLFFWTDDNKSIEYYLIALFFAYIKRIYINKDSILLGLLYFIIPVHTMILNVGMGVIVSIILYFYLIVFLFPKGEKTIFSNYSLIFVLIIGLMFFLYFRSDLLEPIVNYFFEDKFYNLNTRIKLWHYFINRTLKTPFYGIGVLTDRISTRKHGIDYWMEIGNTHNIFIEASYQAGFLNTITAIILIFMALGKVNNAEKKLKYLGVFLIIMLIEGMMELGFASLFLFIPTLYYFNNDTLSSEKIDVTV
jgi:hypothetical protein